MVSREKHGRKIEGPRGKGRQDRSSQAVSVVIVQRADLSIGIAVIKQKHKLFIIRYANNRYFRLHLHLIF